MTRLCLNLGRFLTWPLDCGGEGDLLHAGNGELGRSPPFPSPSTYAILCTSYFFSSSVASFSASLPYFQSPVSFRGRTASADKKGFIFLFSDRFHKTADILTSEILTIVGRSCWHIKICE